MGTLRGHFEVNGRGKVGIAISDTISLAMPTRMHQTTVRFGQDLWQALEREADRLGVSAAHYIRDAALARLAYTEGAAASDSAGAFGWARAQEPLKERVLAQIDSAAAVKAQGRIARERARRARAQANEIRRRRNGVAA